MMLTCSSASSRHTPASAPGLFGRRRLSSVRIAITSGSFASAENANDHTPVLGASVFGLVVADGLVHPVGDYVHLVERDLVLVVQVVLDGLRPFEPQLLVEFGR